jgi:hypothetical protein
MFGKSLSEYLAFQKWFLVAMAVVGTARLLLSLAGVSDAVTSWLSMQAIWLGGFVYYAVAVHTKDFGRYKHILPLLFNQTVLYHAIAILGITIAMFTGQDNVYTAHVKGGFAGRSWGHAGGHLIGVPVFPLVFWLLSWPLFALTRRLTRRDAQTAPRLA